MNRKISVAIIIPSLRAGGTERVMSFIADNLDHKKFDSTLLIIESEEDQAYDIQNTKLVFLRKKRTRNALIALFKYLYKNNFDIVMSSMGQLNILMSYFSLFFIRTKFITRETYVRGLKEEKKGTTLLNFIGFLQKLTINKIICQSKDMYQNLINRYNYKEKQLVIINNPITNNLILKENETFSQENLQLITIGRLSKQKGYDRILNALSKLKIPFKYTIVGSGSEEHHIFKLAESLKIKDRIEHIPFTKEIQKYLARSDIYLQGSYYEGFPNALLESCVVGTPAIAFKAPGGINEILEDGKNGYIVESEEEFINKILFLKDNKIRPELVNQSVSVKYGKEIILQKYETLFKNILNE